MINQTIKCRGSQSLRDWRVKMGLSQAQLAERIGGVKQQRVSRWEQGTRRPDIEIIQRLNLMSNGAVAIKDWVSDNG